MAKLFYLASAISNVAQARMFIRELAERGWTCTFDWTAFEIDPEVGSVLSMDQKADISQQEINGVIEADVMVMLLPGGRGAHVELGAALASSVPVLLVFKTPEDLNGKYAYECIFYRHDGVSWYPYDGEPNVETLAQEMDKLYDAMMAETEAWVASKGG